MVVEYFCPLTVYRYAMCGVYNNRFLAVKQLHTSKVNIIVAYNSQIQQHAK